MKRHMDNVITTNDFDKIILLCGLLKPNETLEVDGFGENGDLVVKIEKDEDFDYEAYVDILNDDDDVPFNLVDMSTYKNGKAIDDSCGVGVKYDLWGELDRIYHEIDMETL